MDHSKGTAIIALPDKVRERKENPCGDSASVDKRTYNMLAAVKSESDKTPGFKSPRSTNSSKEEHKLMPANICASEQFSSDPDTHRMYLKTKGPTCVENDFGLQMNQLVIQAALGGCRWPPYLLVVWVILLVFSHALHCLVSLLAQALPHLKQFSHFLRSCTEAAWQDKRARYRQAQTAILAVLTTLAYAVYLALYSAYVTVLWFLEPMAGERGAEGKHASGAESRQDVTVTDYDEIAKSA